MAQSCSNCLSSAAPNSLPERLLDPQSPLVTGNPSPTGHADSHPRDSVSCSAIPLPPLTLTDLKQALPV